MKRSRTFSMSRYWFIAVLAGTAIAAHASASFGQAAPAPAETRKAAPILFLSGPGGDRFTLVRSANDGWQLRAGWNAAGTGSGKATLAAVEATPLPGPQTLERPLSVLVDGPTGFTFIYVPDEGWKFVGRVVDRAP